MKRSSDFSTIALYLLLISISGVKALESEDKTKAAQLLNNSILVECIVNRDLWNTSISKGD